MNREDSGYEGPRYWQDGGPPEHEGHYAHGQQLSKPPSYHLWRHDSGEVYSVRIESGQCTGCVGPLHHSEWRSDLSEMHYDDDQAQEDAKFVNEAWDDFSEYVPLD